MKILVAETNSSWCRFFQKTLRRWGHDVILVADGNQAWEILQQVNAPQMAILEWELPGMEGIDVCRRVRQRKSDFYVYLLLLTGDSRRERVIEAIDAGADDCLVTPLESEELGMRLHTAVRIHRFQMEHSAAREALGFRASHDLLTGMWNHGAIISLLQKQWDMAQRNGHHLGVIMLDLDHFKKINDVYGHHVGDAVLSETTHRIRSGLRPNHEAGRYGGEEFLIVLPECDGACAIIIAERLRESIAERPIRIQQDMITATCSFGVASSSELPGSDPGWLIRAADAALYRAKRAGRNRVKVATRDDGLTIPSNAYDFRLLETGRASG